MRRFEDESGREWIAAAEEEETPRHHGRWYLVFRSTTTPERELAMPEVRWKNAQTAERTLRTMSTLELRRRLRTVLGRAGEETGAASWQKPPRLRRPSSE